MVQTSAAEVPGNDELVDLISPNRLACSPEEAAYRLSVSRGTVFNLIRRGELDSIRIGRRRVVPVAVLERFIADRLEAGAG